MPPTTPDAHHTSDTASRPHLRRVALAAMAAWILLGSASLAAPSDLTHPAWRAHGERVQFVADAVDGPFEGTHAQRLTGSATPTGRNVIVQSIGRSETGVPYVASVYLRADVPQQLELSSHLARTTCEVDETWRRCVTPVGYGNDVSRRQLHLRVVERGGSFEVYVFGAQYERGETVTPFLDLRPAWIPQSMVNRYDLQRITFLPEDRVQIWRAGLDVARASPWFGVGLDASADAFRDRTREALRGDGVTYAHNLLVQLLAVHGVVGLAGALLNTWDLTLFEPEVLVPATVAMAYWSGRSGTPLGSPRPG